MKFGYLSILVLVAILLCGGCGPAGAPGGLQETAVPPVDSSSTPPSPVIVSTIPSVGTGVAGKPITVIPGGGLPPAGVTVDVQAGQAIKSGPAGRTFTSPSLNGWLYVLIHYPGVLSGDQHTALRAHILSQNGDWQIEVKNPPTGNAFDFGLRGTTVPAALKLQVDGAAGVPVVQFDLQITEALELTADESGVTLTLPVGERFVLALGEVFDWSVMPSDTSIISRVPNITPVRGSQGVYQANAPGKTDLQANGSPPCRQSNPPCSMPNRMVTFTIIVQQPGSSAQPVTFDKIRMATPSKGWGLGWNADGSAGGILKTADGAYTWKQATPPQGMTRESGLVAFFKDDTNAWAAAAAGPRETSGSIPVSVWRTRDGGATWAAGKSFTIPGGGPSSLFFVDDQRGWLMAGLGVAAGSMGVAIYRTTDGGATWAQVSLQNGVEGTTAGALPLGCLKNGIAFSDSTTGYVTGTCYGGDPFLFRTGDGGKTWIKRSLPPAPSFDTAKGCQCETITPQFYGSADGVLEVQGYVGDKFGAAVYVTHDAGATWSALTVPQPSANASFFAISPTMMWLADQANIYSTGDGKNWTTSRLSIKPGIRTLDFVDAQNGFAMPDDVDASGRPFLWVTADGGKSWNAINPALQ